MEISIEPLHLALAYVGMLLHILTKLAELSKTEGFTLPSYVKKNIYTMIASIIMIPVLLIIATDSSMKDILPINNVTSVLAGWQTQSVFKSLMTMFQSKVKVDGGNAEGQA